MISNLSIDSLAYGGAGIGRQEGKTVFVPLTAPGDLISCRITRDKSRYSEGEMVDLLSPSPERREPPCPVFGECGGCQWQHLTYESQCRWKEAIFADTLQRRCGVSAEVIAPLVPAPSEWGYRSRAQFKCRMTRDGLALGFYRRGSHFVIDLEHCPIVAPALNEALRHFRRWLASSPCPDRIPQIDLACDDEKGMRALVHVLDGNADPLARFLRPLAEEAGISLFLQCGRKDGIVRICGNEDLFIHPLADEPLRLAYGPGGFAQVNLEQNRRLVADVLAAAGTGRGGRVLDLFCGMGNFSIPLARSTFEVVGVEDYPPAIAKALSNARQNAAANTRFFACPAAGAATRLVGTRGFDMVVLDPPRTGAYEVVRELVDIRPKTILYVSCDPQTLARDLVPLLHGGYEMVSARAYDLFPQTFHTEGLCVLRLG